MLRLSQSELARKSGVPRPKICIFELGGGSLSFDEQRRIQEALQREAECLRSITVDIDFGVMAGAGQREITSEAVAAGRTKIPAHTSPSANPGAGKDACAVINVRAGALHPTHRRGH